MTTETIPCNCGYNMSTNILYKTRGRCPKCDKLLSKFIFDDTTENTETLKLARKVN